MSIAVYLIYLHDLSLKWITSRVYIFLTNNLQLVIDNAEARCLSLRRKEINHSIVATDIFLLEVLSGVIANPRVVCCLPKPTPFRPHLNKEAQIFALTDFHFPLCKQGIQANRKMNENATTYGVNTKYKQKWLIVPCVVFQWSNISAHL